MEIYLIRHTSVDVPRGTCYGFTDVPLRPSFRHEAATTRLRLAGLTFDKAYTSPLSRAAKLATFCGYPGAERDARLKEMNMGDWEMQRFDDITDERLQIWYDDFLNQPTTGGESFRDLSYNVFPINTDRPRPADDAMSIGQGALIWVRILFMGLVPAALIACYTLTWWRRRKK